MGLNEMLTNRHFHDLNPILMGSQACKPNHTYGPAVRNYTLLHYVSSGTGVLYSGGIAYPVQKGEIFRILPGELTTYRADSADPWSYRWIGFDGALSAKFAELPPVFPVSAAVAQCFTLEESKSAKEYLIVARLFRLYAELFGEASADGNYVRRVQDYVEAAYMQKLSVEEIAHQLNLDRRYLTRLFRQKTGQTVQDYIISVRMAEATRCLSRGLSVGATAERCGYQDVFLFSKMFKRRMGISPATWKKVHNTEAE